MLTMYVDSGTKSQIARGVLHKKGIEFTEIDVSTPKAIEFLTKQGIEPTSYDMPQFYIDEVLVWNNGFKDMYRLTTEEINQKIEEINASN